MPSKVRKIKNFLVKVKIPLAIVGVIFLIILLATPYIKNKRSFWWSVLFTDPLKNTSGVTNVLLLGISGGTHPGADLTDTIILLSFDQKTGKAILISLPRDIWSTTLVAKINSAYHFGEEKNAGGGPALAKTTIEEITGSPLHYFVKIDFAGFTKIIDFLGGVEIKIERAFDDYKFPIEGKENDLCGGDPEYKCRYQHVHFAAGPQILTGEKALEYVRSRNAEGDEGTDFARSKRQQKLILAIKNKIFSLEILSKPKIIRQLLKVLPETVKTDISNEELPYFGKIIFKIKSEKIKNISLEPYLINPPLWQYGQWVLVPRTGDFAEIQNFLREQVLE